MSDPDNLKSDIRKRLFRASAPPGDASARYGYRWCPRCWGRGEVCNEYWDESGRWTAFEGCKECGGEGLRAAD